MTVIPTEPTKQQVTPRRYLKVSDVAALMNVPMNTIYELARQKRIGGMVRVGRHVRFDQDRLEHWLDTGGEGEVA